jgi:hypothetical protein
MATGRQNLVKKLRDNSGGEAYRQWQDNPGANWLPATKPRIIPNAKGSTTKPIPNAGSLNRGLTQGLPRRV